MNWLLLRGLGREKKHWFDFTNKLQAPDSQVMAIDLPGTGDENWTRPPLTIEGHTEFLREKFKSTIAKDASWALLGISLGGMIAMDWASRYPNDFKGMVIINSSTKDLSPIHHRVSPFALYCMARAAATTELRAKEQSLLKMVSNLKYRDSLTLQNMVDVAEVLRVPPQNIARQLIAASQFSAPAEIKIPLLFLASLKDRMVDVRCSKLLAEKYNAQIKFHPLAGHDLPLDDADWVTEHAHEFTKTFC